jgi:lactate dehydrogenase-like 2-hydroxyacid dehydrogenase
MSVPILIAGAPLPSVARRLESLFEVHHLGAALDPAVAARIRGLATTGHGASRPGLVDALPALEIIAHFGVGYDSVDVGAAARRGVVVTNTPDVLTEEVADTALGLLLATVRELTAAERWLRAGRWEAEGPYRLTRGSLRGRRLGILGLGRIGRAIARRAEAFGLAIAYHARNPVPDVAYDYHATARDLAAAVDILLVAAPGGAATRHLVDAEVLRALGPEGFLINVGRGTVVDEAALVEALRSGHILGAGLDVFEDEPRVHPGLLDLDRVVLLPHVASGSVDTRDAMGALQVDNLVSWFEGKGPLTPVPETPVPRR